MSIIGMQIAASKDKRIAQLEVWQSMLEDIYDDDIKTDMIVVGHGHKIGKLAKQCAEQCKIQIDCLNK